jgi:hypothetical protein
MKVGDLVEHRCPPTTQIGKVFLVTGSQANWIKVLGDDAWLWMSDWRVVNESR